MYKLFEMLDLKSANISLRGYFKSRGFGFSCMHKAFELQIEGWFKYHNSYHVNLQVYGTELAIHKMLSWCKKQMPVTQANIEWIDAEWKAIEGFEILNQLEDENMELT